VLPDKIVYLIKKSENILQVLQTTISFKMEHIKFELHIKLFNARHVSLVYDRYNSIET